MIFETVRAIVAEKIKIQESEVTLEKDIIDDLGADSIEVYAIAYAIEDEFGIDDIDDDVQFMRTVKDIVVYLEKFIESHRCADETVISQQAAVLDVRLAYD
ncbi:acyl carrier protein [Desulfococcaceae bacterium HSG7]|nr:acyl carrier protein [Desulfococcaceae bacterium HSG7]